MKSVTAWTIETQIERYSDIGYFDGLALNPDEVAAELVEATLPHEPPVDAGIRTLVTFPESLVSLEARLALTGNRAFLRSEEMSNLTPWEVEPTKPYVLLGFDDGWDRQIRNLSADEARAHLRSVGRTGLRLSELIDMSVHEPSPFDPTAGIRGMYAIETLHELPGEDATVVDLYRYGETLKVKRDPGHLHDEEWTTPSYSRRVVVG